MVVTFELHPAGRLISLQNNELENKMKLLNRKMIATLAGLGGLSALLLMPAVSQANGWRHDHRWHPAGHWVRTQRCHRINFQRYCRNHHGWNQCYTVRHSRFICVY